jgi:hypothetical protein
MLLTIENKTSLLKSAHNHNFIKQGIIHTVYIGAQTGQSITKAGEEVRKLSHKLAEGKPILILSDISQIGKINLGARKKALELFTKMDYDKLAIIGVSFLTHSLVKTVVTVSGRSFKIKTFDSEKEAKNWLKS